MNWQKFLGKILSNITINLTNLQVRERERRIKSLKFDSHFRKQYTLTQLLTIEVFRSFFLSMIIEIITIAILINNK